MKYVVKYDDDGGLYLMSVSLSRDALHGGFMWLGSSDLREAYPFRDAAAAHRVVQAMRDCSLEANDVRVVRVRRRNP